jgi:hypothetical protein
MQTASEKHENNKFKLKSTPNAVPSGGNKKTTAPLMDSPP